jgi:hypothetical protein
MPEKKVCGVDSKPDSHGNMATGELRNSEPTLGFTIAVLSVFSMGCRTTR